MIYRKLMEYRIVPNHWVQDNECVYTLHKVFVSESLFSILEKLEHDEEKLINLMNKTKQISYEELKERERFHSVRSEVAADKYKRFWKDSEDLVRVNPKGWKWYGD
jgi:hypothetical protein